MRAHITSAAPLIVAVANQKGGVGKTTTAINLGAALALGGQRVLIVDLDPQGNASTGLDIQRRDRSPGCYHLLMTQADPRRCMRLTTTTGLSIVSAEADLAGAEIELVAQPRREFRLRDALAELPETDIILIDCPPSLGLLTLNGLVAASSVLVPLQCEFFALEGLSQLAGTIDRIQAAFNPALRIGGILLTMYDRRNKLSELVAADARSFFGERVYREVIPRGVRLSEAPSHGVPVLSYDPRSSGAQAYIRLAREFGERMGLSMKAPEPA